MSESEQKVIDRCESLGESVVRKGLVAGDFGDTPTYFDRLVAERWLSAKDHASATAASTKRDKREQRTLYIAIAAMVIAAMSAHKEIKWLITSLISLLPH